MQASLTNKSWTWLASLLTALVFSFASSAAHAEEKPNPFEKEIAAFEEKDKTLFPTQEQFLFVGSSTIRLWDLKESFPGMPVINRGFGGSHLSDSVHFAKRIVLPYKPQAIVFYAGDNDIASGKTASNSHPCRLPRVCQTRPRALNTRSFTISVKPSPSREKFLPIQRETNDLIKKECDANKWMAFIDTHKAFPHRRWQDASWLYVKNRALSPAGSPSWPTW
ncbi:MAG: hypothetical protein U0894_05310 [Pirellulales bacterium]